MKLLTPLEIIKGFKTGHTQVYGRKTMKSYLIVLIVKWLLKFGVKFHCLILLLDTFLLYLGPIKI